MGEDIGILFHHSLVRASKMKGGARNCIFFLGIPTTGNTSCFAESHREPIPRIGPDSHKQSAYELQQCLNVGFWFSRAPSF